MSWSNAIQATNTLSEEEEEIGINTQVADTLGLRDGMQISCSVIQSTNPIRTLSILLSDDDYQMVECSLDRIQNDMLDQIAIVGRNQPFVLWLNKSITINASVGNENMFFFSSFFSRSLISSIYY
jgi:hypothetical protein